jgi:hypothetical protein
VRKASPLIGDWPITIKMAREVTIKALLAVEYNRTVMEEQTAL